MGERTDGQRSLVAFARAWRVEMVGDGALGMQCSGRRNECWGVRGGGDDVILNYNYLFKGAREKRALLSA